MANLPIAAGIVRPLGSIASNAGQKVALSATSAQTAAPVAANMVFLKSDIACFVLSGSNPTAVVDTCFPLPANQLVGPFAINNGDKIAGVALAAGNLWVYPCQ